MTAEVKDCAPARSDPARERPERAGAPRCVTETRSGGQAPGPSLEAVARRDMRVYTRIMDEVVCLCSNTRRAALALTSLYDEALAPHGLKVTQFSLLHAIKRRTSPNLSTAAEAAGLDRSTLGRNLRVLEGLGLVALSPGDDARDRVVRLTARGEDALRAATKVWLRLQERLSGALGDDAARLLALTRRVATLARDPSHRAAALR